MRADILGYSSTSSMRLNLVSTAKRQMQHRTKIVSPIVESCDLRDDAEPQVKFIVGFHFLHGIFYSMYSASTVHSTKQAMQERQQKQKNFPTEFH